ncbi:MAG TPA: ABC transporter ATP-binding protein [Candidatus Paceibacterota bacterium]|nr:ABC transporter ATP-binding protein [Candidatus Paceibacterota bacterium]
MTLTSSHIYRDISRGRRAIGFVFRNALRGRWKRYLAVVAFGALGSITSGIGIGVLVPLASLAFRGTVAAGGTMSVLVQRVFDVVGIVPSLKLLVLLVIGLFILKALVQFFSRFLLVTSVADFEERMRRLILRESLAMDWLSFAKLRSGHLERMVVDDVTRAGSVLLRGINTILLSFSLSMYFIVALAINWQITLATATLGGILLFVFRPLYRAYREASHTLIASEKDAAHLIARVLQNAKAIKAFNVSEGIAPEGWAVFGLLRSAKSRLAVFQHGLTAAFEPIGAIFVAALFLAVHPTAEGIIAFAATVYLVEKMFGFMQSLQENINLVNEALPGVRVLMDFETFSIHHREIAAQLPFHELGCGISFMDVSFSYEPGRPALSNVTLTIPKGSLTCIIGPSGSGKTTLVDIILGLLRPNSGRVVIDGTNLFDLDISSWRHSIGYVPQDVVLFDGSIAENIRFFDDTVTERDVREAAEHAGIADDIADLPNRYDTMLGERGLGLSGGQRQRIGLARALARHPQLLVLDEATSALDAETERGIEETLGQLKTSTTIVWVTHKESNLKLADRIFDINDLQHEND